MRNDETTIPIAADIAIAGPAGGVTKSKERETRLLVSYGAGLLAWNRRGWRPPTRKQLLWLESTRRAFADDVALADADVAAAALVMGWDTKHQGTTYALFGRIVREVYWPALADKADDEPGWDDL